MLLSSVMTKGQGENRFFQLNLSAPSNRSKVFRRYADEFVGRDP